MTTPNLVTVEATELVGLRSDAARWRYFASRLAAQMSITLEEMAREIDEAIEAEQPEGGGHGHLE